MRGLVFRQQKREEDPPDPHAALPAPDQPIQVFGFMDGIIERQVKYEERIDSDEGGSSVVVSPKDRLVGEKIRFREEKTPASTPRRQWPQWPGILHGIPAC